MLKDAVEQVKNGQSLSSDTMEQVIDSLFQGKPSGKDVKSFLTGLHEKGESADELVGAALAMRKHMLRLQSSRSNIVDTCGTGGSGMATFNISTGAAMVAAAAGASVAKHGSGKVTSKSGSADVLAELGVKIDCSVDKVEKCLDQIGICFCFAPLFQPDATKTIAHGDKLEFPTLFNLVMPLCNPASAPFQLVGVGQPEKREIIAEALARLGVDRAMVVHGNDGVAEITTSDASTVTEVRNGHLAHRELFPEDFGIERAGIELLKVQNAQQSADIIIRVLEGQPGAARDIVSMNAAAALWISGICDDLSAGIERCRMAIDKGHAKQILKELIETTNS